VGSTDKLYNIGWYIGNASLSSVLLWPDAVAFFKNKVSLASLIPLNLSDPLEVQPFTGTGFLRVATRLQ